MESTTELSHAKKGYMEKPSDLRLDMITFEMLSKPGDRCISDKYHLMWRMQEVHNFYHEPHTVTENDLPDVLTSVTASEVLYNHMVRAYERNEYCKRINPKKKVILKILMRCSSTEVESYKKELRNIEMWAYAKYTGLLVAVYILNSILSQ